jgi:hypothetical protein
LIFSSKASAGHPREALIVFDQAPFLIACRGRLMINGQDKKGFTFVIQM